MASDDMAKYNRSSWSCMSMLVVVLLVLGTNLLTVSLLSGGPLRWSIPTFDSATDLTTTTQKLLPSSCNKLSSELSEAKQEIQLLRSQLQASKSLSEELLSRLSSLLDHNNSNSNNNKKKKDHFPKDPDLPQEFRESASAKPLPLGFNPNFGSDKIYPPVGAACSLFMDELFQYMQYSVGGDCPDDELLAQRLMLKGCEPLPRRRCRSQAQRNYVEPASLPESLWSIPHDTSVVWTAYSCKNYTCLVNRKYQKAFDDCKDCFDLEGRERIRWEGPGSGGGESLDYSIDEVLAFKRVGNTGKSSIRIGLDIGGGSGTFAVRMRERDVTIVTTSMNFNAPFNNFIASRGVIPLYISVSQRLPFFDNTLDIVHSMHVLSNWIPTTLLHFIFFDIHRILRPGGLFWLDHFFCIEDQMNQVYIPMIEGIGFKKLKWTIGRKLDRGVELHEMYISALLEKPL
ncbi:hypothetical protein AMTRI_Chr04g247190 [Amborella trichopoda]|uniref:Methyltransferase type 11 domain-containing protein n=1 Tax=Amborella trichopoda TaxID=13333 RepID=W1NEK1_AMBTC|nr:uncharacterized protein LOC18421746 [Amborella trichopoda]ERM93851.1 hypothetical protein AMTR_s00138p00094100 [Amborella trichopoda]|eukprot:XP_006826614.1 uncharacterized protein LOC18421746 [Amborella trichopoda]